jgi:chromosome segregation ATPase
MLNKNEGKVLADKLKHNETELNALRSELQYSRETMEQSLQESEQKRIKLNAQATALEQKLYAKNEEV